MSVAFRSTGDARMRTTARGLGASVTGTVGLVVRAVEVGLDREEAHTLVSQIDSHGTHMTGTLRDAAIKRIDGPLARRDTCSP